MYPIKDRPSLMHGFLTLHKDIQCMKAILHKRLLFTVTTGMLYKDPIFILHGNLMLGIKLPCNTFTVCLNPKETAIKRKITFPL